MYVENAMVTDVISCMPQTSAQDIAMMMWNNDCGAIPVLDNEERPIAIVTDRDIAMCAALQNRALRDISAQEIYNSQQLICCNLKDDIQQALDMMESNQIRRIPVVNEYGQLCGMLTMGDIVSFTRAKGARKKTNSQIDIGETMDFLKHISAHHENHKMVAEMG